MIIWSVQPPNTPSPHPTQMFKGKVFVTSSGWFLLFFPTG